MCTVYASGLLYAVCVLRKVLKDSENIQIHIDDDGRDEKQKKKWPKTEK